MAQTLPDSALRPLLHAPMTMTELPTAPPAVAADTPSAESRELSRTRLRRGTWMTAAGLTMAIIGSSLLAATVRTKCTETGRPSPVAMGLGGVTLGVGVALGIGGGWHLQHQPYRDPVHRGGRIAGATALGLGLGMSASFLPLFFGVMDAAFCSDY